MNKIYIFLIKTLICISIFLCLGILCKTNNNYKNYIYNKLYQEYFDFSKVKIFYNKYLGGIFPIESIGTNNLNSVFNEKLIYLESGKYEEGAILKVGYNYLVPSLSEGIVVYMGNKDKYGSTLIIEGSNDIDIWYGNICNIIVKNYDVISKGSYLGESCNDKIYIVYTKKNEFLNYEDYLI